MLNGYKWLFLLTHSPNQNTLVMNIDFGLRFESWFCHLQVVWHRKIYYDLGFYICIVDTITASYLRGFNRIIFVRCIL